MPAPPEAPDALLAAAADRFGTPAYVYLADAIEDRIATLRQSFGRWFGLSYAVKANPNPALLAWMLGRVDSLDISSGGELARALAAGWDPARLSFTGPAKREAELAAAVSAGPVEMVLESLREARALSRLAVAAGRVQPVLVRLSPDRVPRGFGDHMAGRPSPFGIDVEEAAPALAKIAALPGLALSGLHIYSGTQSLKPEAIAENWRIFLDIFRSACAGLDLAPDRLVFGAGLGIPYHEGDMALDLSAIAADIGHDLDAFRAEPRFAATRLTLELGRYLVGEAGFFLTRVVALKASRGATLALCDGGMNAHLAASGHFGMVIKRNYRMHRVGGGTPTVKVDLTGPLCTSIDRLGSGVLLPPLVEGDVIAIHASGAYGPTASPTGFISHPTPREVLAQGGQLSDVTVGPGTAFVNAK